MYLISTNSGIYKSLTRSAINEFLKRFNLQTINKRGTLKLPEAFKPFIIEMDGRHWRGAFLQPINAYNGIFPPFDDKTPKIARFNLAELLDRVSPAKPELNRRKLKNADRRALNLISKNNCGRFAD